MNSLLLDIRQPGEAAFHLEVQCELPGKGVTAIYGPSGSGKTSLLDCIAGLRVADPGSVIRFRDHDWQSPGKCLPAWRRNVGYVFQDARLFPHLSAAGNLNYAWRRRRSDNGPTIAKVSELLHLTDLLGQSPAHLSAGQRQRVAIGRALVSAPELLLLDEPLANLDHRSARQCLGYLQDLAGQLDLPMLYVSHNIEEVSQLADNLLLLEAGEVIAFGPTLDLCSALDNRLTEEEQAAAIAICTIASHDTEFALTELSLEGYPLFVGEIKQDAGNRRRLRIPARDVSVCRQRPANSSILNILPVTLEQMRDSGEARVMLRLAVGSQHLLARITRKSAHQLNLQPGDALFAQVKSAALLMENGDRQ